MARVEEINLLLIYVSHPDMGEEVRDSKVHSPQLTLDEGKAVLRIDRVQCLCQLPHTRNDDIVSRGQSTHVAQQGQAEEGHIAGDDQSMALGRGFQPGENASERCSARVDICNHQRLELIVCTEVVSDDDDLVAELSDFVHDLLDEWSAVHLKKGFVTPQTGATSARKDHSTDRSAAADLRLVHHRRRLGLSSRSGNGSIPYLAEGC